MRSAARWLAALAAAALVPIGTVALAAAPAQASTAQFRGINWADQRDNFVNGVLYPSGLGASDTYASASAVADAVVGQLYSLTGANTVRLPVNEPTVSTDWGTYTGAIDTALTKGKVILAYWAYSGGKPASTSAFNAMWDKIVAKYGGNPNAYFEVINEPSGFSAGDLTNFYNTWLGRYPSVPRGRVILDGSGLAWGVADVGRDSRLNGTLIAVHDYTFFAGTPMDSETEWENHLGGYVGAYADRTVATEWGGPMGPGSKYDIQWKPMDYSIPSGSYFADYIRGLSSKLRSLGMGSVYWPGLRDGDWYSLTSRTGSGSGTRLTVVNPSGVTRLQYAWGVGDGGSTTVAIRNATNGRYLDGLGGSGDAGQGPDNASANRQWVVENVGNFVRLRNRGTGLYLDGMGRTAAGAGVGQYADSAGSSNQQWTVLTAANNVRLRNRATGRFVTVSGSGVAQTGDGGSTDQQWQLVPAAGGTTTTTTTTTSPTSTTTTTGPTTSTTSTTSTTTTTTTTSTTGGTSGCRVAFAPSAWATGFTLGVTITNTSATALDGWRLSFTLPAGQTLTSGWNAAFSGSTGTVTATNLAYNAAVPAGGNVQFGFQGTLSGAYATPAAATLNGTACTIG